ALCLRLLCRCFFVSPRAVRVLPSFPTRRSSDLAKLTAFVFSLATLALVVPLWLSYDPDGERLQQTSSMDWIPAWGIHISFGIDRSEEHTSELQSRENLVCRLLLEKKKTT